MQGQLYARYLANDEYSFGIYAVAYFHCDAWNRKDDTRKTSGASRMPIADLVVQLRTQAQALSSSEKHIEAIVIDARINRD